MKHFIIISITIFILTGCQTMSPTPSSEEMNKANFGTKPNMDGLIKKRLSRSLIDPSSLTQLSISKPKKCGKKCGFGTPVYGWCSTYEYNAKNRMGGYGGLSQHDIMVFNEKVIYEDGMFTSSFHCGDQ